MLFWWLEVFQCHLMASWVEEGWLGWVGLGGT